MSDEHLRKLVAKLRWRLRARGEVVRIAGRLVAAADACDREAERQHPSSRSSAPVVRYINAMKRLREALDRGQP